MTGELIRRGKDTERHTHRRPCEDGGRDWSWAAISQAKPVVTSSWERQERILP